MEAQAASEALLRELLRLQTDQEHDDLKKRLEDLAERQENELWERTFQCVQDSILKEVAGEEGSDQEATVLVDFVVTASAVKIPESPAFMLTLKHLHNMLVVLESAALRERILSLCERWCLSQLPDWEDLWTNTFLHHVKLSLQAPAPKKHVTKVCQLMKGLETQAGAFQDPDQMLLLQLVARCAASPNYLATDKTRHFVAYLLKQNAVVVRAVYEAVDAAFPSMNRHHAEVLGGLYLSAWKARTPENEKALEDSIQDVMFTAVNGDLAPNYHENLFKFLSVLHSAWSDVEVAKMLFLLYQPILWRGLKVPNCMVRKSAARVFFDAFPLLEHWQVSAREHEIRERCDLIRFLLSDPTPIVRAVAVKGTTKALACYYDLFPYDEKKRIMSILLKKNSRDANSQESRRQVLLGLERMVKNAYTHNQLCSVLPSTKHCLYDSSNKVRAAFVSLLYAARGIYGFLFKTVVGPDELLNVLPGECTPVARGIVRVLLNTYFNPRVSAAERVHRCLALMQRNRKAGMKFYFELVHVSGSGLVMEFLLSICTVLKFNFGAAGKENASPRREGDDDDEEDEGEEEEVQARLRGEQVAQLLDTLAVMFTSLKNKVRVKKSEQFCLKWKLLHVRMTTTLRLLLKNITDVNLKLTCLYLASLMHERSVIPTLGRQCMSLLETIAESAEADPARAVLDMKSCLYTACRAHKAADVLSCVSDWLGQLHGQKTPRKKRVRFNEPRGNPGLALDILRCLLEMSQAVQLLLQHHLVPIFETWSVLLRIVGTLKELVCDSKNPRPDELLFRAFDIYLRMTLLLSNQEHPATKEKFNTPAAVTCQMTWIRDDLLPVIAVQTSQKRSDSVRVLQIYLKNTSDVFRLNLANRQFAEDTLDFLKKCRDCREEELEPLVAEVVRVVDGVKILLAGDDDEEASLNASLASLQLSQPPEHTPEHTPGRAPPKERRVS